MQVSNRRLPFGAHFGAGGVHCVGPGFSVSVLNPIHRAEDVPLHTHDNASLIFVLSGAYRSSADGTSGICSVPTLIFNPPGTTHRDSFLLPNGSFLAISVSHECVRLADGVLPTSAIAFAEGEAMVASSRLAQACLSPPPNALTVEALCWDMLSSVAGEKLCPERGSTPPWIPRAKELLHDQCDGSQSVAIMARVLGVHPVYFARAFRRHFRCTPVEYRQRCRLSKAMALLNDRKYPLAEIASVAGFFDQSHLNHAFQRHFGITPDRYRRHLHGSNAQV